MRLAILKDNMLLSRNHIFEFSSIGPILFNMIFSQNNLISLCTYSNLTLKSKYSDLQKSRNQIIFSQDQIHIIIEHFWVGTTTLFFFYKQQFISNKLELAKSFRKK